MAIPRIERERNTYDEPNTPEGITLNTTTYTKILETNEDRVFYRVSNLSQNTILIREKADVDELDRGYVRGGRSKDGSYVDNPPVGEVWAKAITGTPEVLVMEV